MINKPPPSKDLNIRIPILIAIKGRGFGNQGSTYSTPLDSELVQADLATTTFCGGGPKP